jgi:hypothetical protein
MTRPRSTRSRCLAMLLVVLIGIGGAHGRAVGMDPLRTALRH